MQEVQDDDPAGAITQFARQHKDHADRGIDLQGIARLNPLAADVRDLDETSAFS